MEEMLADELLDESPITSDAYQQQVERIPLFTTAGGEEIYRQKNSLVVKLPPGRSAVTTSWLNGGQRDDLECIFNHTIPYYVDDESDLEGGNLFSYLSITAKSLGFDASRCAGLLTAASMENVSIVSRSFRGVQVTAVVTGGIDINGGRAGRHCILLSGAWGSENDQWHYQHYCADQC
ncbi:adenosylcobinamide amidohydrolase [uncultured Methanomethylovorans sp.]|uniref:adenosylcobinamide amidohydrolase n=1 Tax=uncultured Methanomethylovorans sp. TaxID=183759 RepID=UPI002AA7C9BB|nr:adenosylcobinamide amidohydrolase [uncultured Methanomethylovorans sp.]